VELHVDLNVAPLDRWASLRDHRDVARALIASYLRDLGGAAACELAAMARGFVVPPEYDDELRGAARALDVPELELVTANLYYDALKAALGCTAFVVDTDDGPLHARNLDWWTEDAQLSRHTIEIDVRGASAGPYRMVGWPGFLGCFSAVAPGRFAISLNAVSSRDALAPGTAVVFELRRVLERARDFAEAVEQLTRAPLCSDSLLLVSGVERGEMAVIERTPTRAAVRTGAPIVVTNDYRALDAAERSTGALGETSCRRYDRATARLGEVRDAASARAVLDDPEVKMGITVQQMVMSARRGTIVR
jgi:acid ceramidase